MKLKYASELLCATAFGMALARLAYLATGRHGRPFGVPPSEKLALLLGGFITGFVLVEFIALLIERAISRGARRGFGIGRKSWAIAGLYVILNSMFYLLYFLIDHKINRRNTPVTFTFLIDRLILLRSRSILGDLSWAVAALWIVSRLAGDPRDPSPDAREILGRVFAGFVVGAAIAIQAMITFGY
jgi:hypothetical protein